uniref:ATP synthase F(0) complex subunit f, mitochondrial n=1 Tax=Prolemur simus TaxID=1328070 RepID=A0A8C8Z920_PROSS
MYTNKNNESLHPNFLVSPNSHTNQQLMDVKLGELPSWILMQNFTLKGIAGAFQRGHYWYYNKHIDVKKGSIAGVSMVLAAYVLFNYCLSYKELKHEQQPKYG